MFCMCVCVCVCVCVYCYVGSYIVEDGHDMFCMCVCVVVCSVTLDLISSSIVLEVFVIIIISVIFTRNFILPGIRYIEISTKSQHTVYRLE